MGLFAKFALSKDTVDAAVKITKVVGLIIGAGHGSTLPPLTHESSSVLSRFIRTASETEEIVLEDIVLQPAMRERIQHFFTAIKNTKTHQVPFRHMLFYGAPGTGKTMVAREIARNSAKQSRKGLLILIDDAESFLSQGKSLTMTEPNRRAVNAVLFRMADQSKDVVLLLATNSPQDLDAAIINQMDESIEFSLPGEKERYQLLKFYLEKAGTSTSMGDTVLSQAAKRTEGFSCRQIAKLVAGIVVNGGPDCFIGSRCFEQLLELNIQEHHKKGDRS